jgi:hypothetical protein
VKVLRVNPEEREIDFAILGTEEERVRPQQRKRRR